MWKINVSFVHFIIIFYTRFQFKIKYVLISLMMKMTILEWIVYLFHPEGESIDNNGKFLFWSSSLVAPWGVAMYWCLYSVCHGCLQLARFPEEAGSEVQPQTILPHHQLDFLQHYGIPILLKISISIDEPRHVNY